MTTPCNHPSVVAFNRDNIFRCVVRVKVFQAWGSMRLECFLHHRSLVTCSPLPCLVFTINTVVRTPTTLSRTPNNAINDCPSIAQVLVCATCHRFVGTEATQLAMLEGLPRNTSANLRGKKKRSRDGGSGDPGSNGESESGGTARRAYSSPSSATAVAATPSRRLAVAEAPCSDLPDLPALTGVSSGQNGSMSSSACDGGANSTPAAGVTAGDDAAMLGGTAVDAVGCSREGVGEERGGCYRCDGGAPCDDVYCSTGCRADAVVAGHGLICAGGRDEGR